MLGEKLLKLRKEKNITQEQLAEQIDVTRQTISNWELDETLPNTEQLKKISKVFEISIDELLDNEIKRIDKKEENIVRKKVLTKVFIAITIIWIIAATVAFIEKNYIPGIINILTALVAFTTAILIKNKKD